MDKTYILNRETGKIELNLEKSEYDTLPEDKKRLLKSNYLFRGKLKVWVSRAKFPNLYFAKSVAKELGFTDGKTVGERLSYAEQMEKRTERAEARADRYLGYAENAKKRGSKLQKELNDIHGDIAFFTQPIITGHAGSESFAKRRQRIYDRYDKGMEEYRKSEYFQERAAIAMVTAENAKLKDPTYLNNRIKECKTEIKKIRKTIEYYERLLEELKDPQSSASVSKKHSSEKINELLEDELEILEIQVDKLGYFENCVEEIGGFKFNCDNIKVGYVVKIHDKSKMKVLKTNPKTVLVRCLSTNMILNYDYAEITEVVSAVEEKIKETAEIHPFKKDDILEWNPQGSHKPLAVYQVISTTEKTVQIRRVKQDAKRMPLKDVFVDNSKLIRRTPYKCFGLKGWRVHGDNNCVLTKYENKKGEAE